ncbi:MAG TPA: DUF2461 domain-containing protein [Mariprofundaceae bacterium]|nr:DUF2461 domain-containing protein [Mariprofundaceae bacterium]
MAELFSSSTFDFLDELAANNSRDWFEANKHRYEDEVRSPALSFIESMAPVLAEIAPHFRADARKMGGSLMRVYRDTRFSRDKTPYKTNIGIQFRHESGKDVHAPGYYVHISVQEVFLAVGTWHPEAEPLAKIRQHIVDKPADWVAARDDAEFRRYFQLDGDSLQRPPKGFPADHPEIDDIKRKDFIAVSELSTDSVEQPDFADICREQFVAATPFMRFLCKGVGVPF